MSREATSKNRMLQPFKSFNRSAQFKPLRRAQRNVHFFRNARDLRFYLHWVFEGTVIVSVNVI